MKNITYDLLIRAPDMKWGMNLIKTTSIYLADSAKDIEENWKKLRPCLIHHANPFREQIYRRFVEIGLFDARIEVVRYLNGPNKGEIVSLKEKGVDTIAFFLKDDSGKVPVCMPSIPNSPARTKLMSGEFRYDDHVGYIKLFDFYHSDNLFIWDMYHEMKGTPRIKRKKKLSAKLEELLNYPGVLEPIRIPQ